VTCGSSLSRSRLDHQGTRYGQCLAASRQQRGAGVSLAVVDLDRPGDHDMLLARYHGAIDSHCELRQHRWTESFVAVAREVGRAVQDRPDEGWEHAPAPIGRPAWRHPGRGDERAALDLACEHPERVVARPPQTKQRLKTPSNKPR
jgi:hypothetical protein